MGEFIIQNLTKLNPQDWAVLCIVALAFFYSGKRLKKKVDEVGVELNAKVSIEACKSDQKSCHAGLDLRLSSIQNEFRLITEGLKESQKAILENQARNHDDITKRIDRLYNGRAE